MSLNNDQDLLIPAETRNYDDCRCPPGSSKGKSKFEPKVTQDSKNSEPESHCHSDLSLSTESASARNKLLLACALVLVFMISEFIGGFIANSLAIMTDAFHLLSDFAGFCISLFAIWFGSRPATKNMSFGYYRAEVLGAVMSVLLIWVLTGILVYLAFLRIMNQDYEIDADVMLLTAGCGLLVNIVLGVVLFQGDIPHDHGGFGHSSHGHSHSHSHSHSRSSMSKMKSEARSFYQPNAGYDAVVEAGALSNSTVDDEIDEAEEMQKTRNINVRAAFIHCLGDLVQSIGVLIAATIIKIKPSWILADPICTFLFSLLVLFTTLTIMWDAVRILMEGKPADYEYDRIIQVLKTISGVNTVHNLHVWSLSIDKVALSVHLTIEPEANQEVVLSSATRKLKSEFQFSHTTIQVEHYIPHLMADCKLCNGPEK